MLDNKIINRLFISLILLFFATPFLVILYGQLQGNLLGIDIQTLIEQNVQFNLMFIMGFITPFIGFYMFHLKKELEKAENLNEILVSLILILLSFLIMGNLSYALFMGILVYFMMKNAQIRMREIFKSISYNKTMIKNQLASIVFILLSILIKLAQIKINTTI